MTLALLGFTFNFAQRALGRWCAQPNGSLVPITGHRPRIANRTGARDQPVQTSQFGTAALRATGGVADRIAASQTKCHVLMVPLFLVQSGRIA